MTTRRLIDRCLNGENGRGIRAANSGRYAVDCSYSRACNHCIGTSGACTGSGGALNSDKPIQSKDETLILTSELGGMRCQCGEMRCEEQEIVVCVQSGTGVVGAK